MATRLTLAALALLAFSFSSCKKEQVEAPAVKVEIISVSYPPDENDGYVTYQATVQLKKTDGSFEEEKVQVGTGSIAFEQLAPGEYWINERTTRASEKFVLGPGEIKEIRFTIP